MIGDGATIQIVEVMAMVIVTGLFCWWIWASFNAFKDQKTKRVYHRPVEEILDDGRVIRLREEAYGVPGEDYPGKPPQPLQPPGGVEVPTNKPKRKSHPIEYGDPLLRGRPNRLYSDAFYNQALRTLFNGNPTPIESLKESGVVAIYGIPIELWEQMEFDSTGGKLKWDDLLLAGGYQPLDIDEGWDYDGDEDSPISISGLLGLDEEKENE